jgi:SAM-dependent MidA family methyltransferase
LSPIPLKRIILDLLARERRMTFERYMALCLYHPECGYYAQGRERTGVRGDYFTSPDLHPIFARLVARQAAEMWERLGRPETFTWVEMGPGGGWFARDFLEFTSHALPEFDRALDYVAVESAPRALRVLRARLDEGGIRSRVRLVENLEALHAVTGCFFSNELVDAFPVSVVTRVRGSFREIYVVAEGEELGERPGPMSDPAVAAYVARYAQELENDHRVEVNLRALDWLRAVASKLARGFVLTIDYGDLAERLYTPDRPRGTLLAYEGHRATEDYFKAPGEQDLTAHVNFSALMDTGRSAGLETTGFTTQERFLLALGEANEFADLYGPDDTEASRLDARLKLKRLINPEGMGGIFKVLIQHRSVSRPELTGLKFARPRK